MLQPAPKSAPPPPLWAASAQEKGVRGMRKAPIPNHSVTFYRRLIIGCIHTDAQALNLYNHKPIKMKKIYFAISVLAFATASKAQPCNPGSARARLDINNVSTTMLNSGDMWWDLTSASYEV